MRNAAGRSTAEIVSVLKYLHVNRVELKCVDGSKRMYTGRSSAYAGEPNVTPELVHAIQSAGITVYGWGFNWGKDPAGELSAAIAEVDRLGLVGWVWDVEETFLQQKDPPAIMNSLGMGMSAAFPDLIQGFCCMPILHKPGDPKNPYWNRKVWEAAALYCAEGIPMAYWYKTNLQAAGDFVVESILQWQEGFEWEVIPALRAWYQWNGQVQPSWIRSIVQRTIAAGRYGLTWWSLDEILKWPALYRAIAETYDELEEEGILL